MAEKSGEPQALLEEFGAPAEAPKPEVLYDYVEVVPVFKAYGKALRDKDFASAGIYERILDLEDSDHFCYFRIPRSQNRIIQADLRIVQKERVAEELRAALDNPEGVDPRALGDMVARATELFKDNPARLGELLHRGY